MRSLLQGWLSLCLLPAVLTTGVSCGQFHTERFYESDGDTNDVVVDVQRDEAGFDLCVPQETPVLTTEEIPEGRMYVPFLFQLTSGPPELMWRVVSGALPAGTDIAPTTGVLSGVPLESGSFEFVVRLTNESDEPECAASTDIPLVWNVGENCTSDADCSDFPNAAGRCTPDGCELPVDSCGEGAARTRWEWQGDKADPLHIWTIDDHHKLVGNAYDPKNGYRYRLVLVADGETRILDYSTSDEVPLPLRTGDVLANIVQPSASYSSRLLGLELQEHPSALLFDGWLEYDETFGALVQDLGVESLSLQMTNCEGSEDQCGNQQPGVLAFGGNQWDQLAVAGDRIDWNHDQKQMEAVVGSAYRYSSFSPGQCPGISPAFASFRIAAADRCPPAQVQSSSLGLEALGNAFQGPPVVYFSGGARLEWDDPLVKWNWALEQPLPGLVSLSNKGGAPPLTSAGAQELRLPVCGTWRVGLSLEDSSGRTTCVEDVVEIRVLPEPELDLRIEMVWSVPDSQSQTDVEDVDLLLRFPSAATTGNWDDSVWVCSQDNPYPLDWSWGSKDRPDLICQCSAGQMELGRPEVITLETINTSFVHPYSIGVRAAADNEGAVAVSLQVYLSGKLVYRRLSRQLEPGELWKPGNISSIYRAFIPVQG